jgi:hypothetical protein
MLDRRERALISVLHDVVISVRLARGRFFELEDRDLFRSTSVEGKANLSLKTISNSLSRLPLLAYSNRFTYDDQAIMDNFLVVVVVSCANAFQQRTPSKVSGPCSARLRLSRPCSRQLKLLRTRRRRLNITLLKEKFTRITHMGGRAF